MVRNYLKAGILLHMITAVELTALSLVVTDVVNLYPAKLPVCVLLSLYTLFTQLDARSRYQEFKKASDQLFRYGPDKRIFRSLSGSRCQRDAVFAAASLHGFNGQCTDYFRSAGYRWYHLLPDFVVNHPCHLISKVFWQTTFFLPAYRQRYHADRETRLSGIPEEGRLTRRTANSIVGL